MSPRAGTARGGGPAAGGRSSADLTGWLFKRGEGNTAFKRRFFVLSNKSLAYFEDEKAQSAKGEVELDCSMVEESEDAPTPGRYRFELTVFTKGLIGRTYILEAADDAVRREWVEALMWAAGKAFRALVVLPEGCRLEDVVGPPPADRKWQQEWCAMRMEQLRHEGNTEKANRTNCGAAGVEGIEAWSEKRGASIAWKGANGWDADHAVAYTLLTGCNRAALARSVCEKSAQYAASLHLISRSLGSIVVHGEPAPDTFCHLLGFNGLATNDATWSVLLKAGAAEGLRFVITSPAMARDDPCCFPLNDRSTMTCRGFHDKHIAGAGGEDTQYRYVLMKAPVVRFVSSASSAEAPGAPPSHHTLVQVDGVGNRWEVPALATVTLVSIDSPGTWGAFKAERVMRTRYTVTVSWHSTCASDGGASSSLAAGADAHDAVGGSHAGGTAAPAPALELS